MDTILGSSPTSTLSSPIGELSKRVSLDDFVREIPSALARRRELPPTVFDPVDDLFHRLDISREEWISYAFLDQMKNYTRNLIATDHESFTLLLLCWNPMKESPIHDHPCDGCWLRVLQGCVQECRYRESSHGLELTDETICQKGEVCFIEDSLGYHKVGNPGNEIAVTLHLYAPPFASCRLWKDADAIQSTRSNICYYSMYGEKVDYTVPK